MLGPSCTREASREHVPRDARTVTRAVQVALARVQASSRAWTCAELMRQTKAFVPAEQLGLDPDAAVALVDELTDRALVGEFEPAQCLDAPEIVAAGGPSCALMRGDLEDVKRHITVTDYCQVLDRFIEKNPGYAPLIDSGNSGTDLRATVMPWLPPVCNTGCAQPSTRRVNQRKDAG